MALHRFPPVIGANVIPRLAGSRVKLRQRASSTSKLTYPVLTDFFEAVRELVEQGGRQLVLDLGAVSYIDSATIGCLVEIHRLVDGHGGAVKLVALQRRVHTMLSMTGVVRFLEVYDGEAEALASLRKQRSREGGFVSKAEPGPARR